CIEADINSNSQLNSEECIEAGTNSNSQLHSEECVEADTNSNSQLNSEENIYKGNENNEANMDSFRPNSNEENPELISNIPDVKSKLAAYTSLPFMTCIDSCKIPENDEEGTWNWLGC
ncbi:unnamed protein product, partial [Meganyctiphanes norvegica]